MLIKPNVVVHTNIDSVTISSDKPITLTSGVDRMQQLIGIPTEEFRKLAGTGPRSTDQHTIANDLPRSRSKEELEQSQVEYVEAMKKFVDTYGNHSHSTVLGPSTPPTEVHTVKSLQAENAKLREKLEQAQNDANRLRGGVTEKRRYLKLSPAGSRSCELEDKHSNIIGNYSDTIFVVDDEVEHLLVVQDPQMTCMAFETLDDVLRKRYGKRVLLVNRQPNTELSLLEIVR